MDKTVIVPWSEARSHRGTPEEIQKLERVVREELAQGEAPFFVSQRTGVPLLDVEKLAEGIITPRPDKRRRRR